MKPLMTVLIALSMLLSVRIASPQEAGSEVVSGSWAVIKALPPADDLTVQLRDGTRKRGRSIQATDEILSVADGRKTLQFNRRDIWQVYRSLPRRRSRFVVTGAVIGGVLGMLGGSESDRPKGMPAGVAVAVGGIVDAGLGALIGYGISGRGERVLIYEAVKQ
jgi:hypothetical protein